MKQLKGLLQLLRPEQWLKNAFVFIPLFFDAKLFDLAYVNQAAIIFLAFSFAASAIYCLNDIQDIERDRLHPRKRFRPIASGVISTSAAYATMSFCVLASLLLACIGTDTYSSALIILTYLLLNVAYCFKLKHYAIVDVFIIATGFVLRIFAGGACCNIHLTPWIVLMVFLLALFLAFAKRRDDVLIYEHTGTLARSGIDRYNLPFMNQIIGLIATITIVCYILYTVNPDVVARFDSEYVYLTAVWVIAAMIKYLQITMVDLKSGSPTKVLLTNRFVQACIVGWGIHFLILIYC